MDPNAQVAKYLPAAQIDEIPSDLSKPRHIHSQLDGDQLRAKHERYLVMTEIWGAGNSDAERRAALDAYAARTHAKQDVVDLLDLFLRKPLNRLPLSEIEFAMGELGLADAHNGVLSKAEKDALDRDGYVNLGPLLSAEQVRAMRDRYDAAIEEEGASAAHSKGIGRIEDTVVKSMNHDGLLDPIFMHPRLLAAVRHILGVHLKYIGSNFHCPLPGYGHQGIHADYMWGVREEAEVVNAVWMIDDFTDDNGATRVVPGSHRCGLLPIEDVVSGEIRDPNAPVEGEVLITGAAGSCLVYNAHMWHGGTQNCTDNLRRAQHVFFSRSIRPSSTDVPAVIDKAVHERLDRVARAILDIE
jgi:ectoine hydroxylase-related dioxygenase (phytanoyl-CoA dioxygenase family)